MTIKTIKLVCPECNNVTHIQDETLLCSHCQTDLDNPFPIEVTDESCQIHIDENDIPVLIDFYSTTCGPCMAMYEDYEDAALPFGTTVRFLKINADTYQEVAKAHGVGALPTIIAFYKSQEVNRHSRQLSQVELTLWAESLVEHAGLKG